MAEIEISAFATLRRLGDGKVLHAETYSYRDRDKLRQWTANDLELWHDYVHFARHYLAREISFDAAIVDLGDRIEASILVTNYLKKLGVRAIIARAESQEHGEILDLVGATKVVFPNQEAARRIAPWSLMRPPPEQFSHWNPGISPANASTIL